MITDTVLRTRFQKLADNGNDVFQEMLDELKTRDEFKGVFENKDA